MRRSLESLLVCVLVALTSTPAAAISYASLRDREIVQAAEVVIRGTVTQIISPPDVVKRKKDAISVAVVRVAEVFKGDVKKGGEIRFVFWSHDAKPKRKWYSPAKYEVKEVITLALNRKQEKNYKQFLAPKEAAAAPWANYYRPVYNKQVQSDRFRRVAEIWREPAKHLSDPDLRGDAAIFLAHRSELSDEVLLKLLNSTKIADQRIGCEAAGITQSRVALKPLVAIIETRSNQLVRARDWPTNKSESKRQREIHDLYNEARRTIHRLPINGAKDGRLVLRLARCGGMTNETTAILLRAGKARWDVTQGLIKSMKDNPTDEAAAALQQLDARAAYKWVKLLAERSRAAGRLVNEYDTLWAMHFVLDYARVQTGGFGEDIQYRYVLDSFGFTHDSISPYDRRKDAGKGDDTWKTLYAELRRNAQEQLRVTEKKGPNFDRLPVRLKTIASSEVHVVGGKKFVTLNESQREELMELVVRYADVSADKLDARAPAVWLVDLYRDPVYGKLPTGQLWVATDGTFGISWLPDRAWGKSERLVAWLKDLAKD